MLVNEKWATIEDDLHDRGVEECQVRAMKGAYYIGAYTLMAAIGSVPDDYTRAQAGQQFEALRDEIVTGVEESM